MESNDSPEIPDRGETSNIPGLPSGVSNAGEKLITVIIIRGAGIAFVRAPDS